MQIDQVRLACRFLAALGSGEKQLAEILQKSEKSGVVKGSDAFVLYDTFGFPLEITMDAAAEQNIKVNFFTVLLP